MRIYNVQKQRFIYAIQLHRSPSWSFRRLKRVVRLASRPITELVADLTNISNCINN